MLAIYNRKNNKKPLQKAVAKSRCKIANKMTKSRCKIAKKKSNNKSAHGAL